LSARFELLAHPRLLRFRLRKGGSRLRNLAASSFELTDLLNQPLYFVLMAARFDPFGLAGLYERWLSPEGEVLDTCTIVTTSACGALRDVHDRMPVIVPEADHARWLDRAEHDVVDLLAPWSGEPLRIYPVSTRVNAVRNDDAQLCDPVAPVVEASSGREPATPKRHGERGAQSSDDADEAVVDADDPVQPRLF
jgi:hypothetical protein